MFSGRVDETARTPIDMMSKTTQYPNKGVRLFLKCKIPNKKTKDNEAIAGRVNPKSRYLPRTIPKTSIKVNFMGIKRKSLILEYACGLYKSTVPISFT